MRTVQFTVSKRDSAMRAALLRKGGLLPGIVYGAGGPSVELAVSAHEFGRAGLGGGGAHLLKFKSDDASLDGSVALIKEVQHHPVKGNPIHVDFLRIDINKPVETPVTLHYVGKPLGVVNSGGILQPIRRELEVRALPINLPEEIEIDVSALEIGDAIHLEDITLPEGVESVETDNFTLVTVVPPVVEKVEEPSEGEEGVEAAAAGGEGAEGEGAEKGEKAEKKSDD